MNIPQVIHFFKELDRRLNLPLRVILTGGAAAIVMGVERSTEDIDFEVEVKVEARKKAGALNALKEALVQVEAVTRITPQFSEDIDRWSSIVMPVKKSRLWMKVGKIEIRILDTGLWAIGKLSRYLGTDEYDLVTVFKKTKSNPRLLVRLWGKALGKSPGSSAQSLFRNHVQSFLMKNGREIWGKKCDSEKLFEEFLKSARATTPAS